MSEKLKFNANKVFPIVFIFLLIIGLGIYSIGGSDAQKTIDDFDEDAQIKQHMEDEKSENDEEELDQVEGLKKGPKRETYKDEVDEDKEPEKEPEIEKTEAELDQAELEERLDEMISELEFDFGPELQFDFGFGEDSYYSDDEKEIDTARPGNEMPEKPEPPEKPVFEQAD